MRRVALALVMCTACSVHTKIPYQDRKAMALRHKNRVVDLRVSSYFGDLYDDNEKWLLSPYPFHSLRHIVDLNGEPIRPKGQRGIIAAGTSFRIEKIEFPNASAMVRRMLTTPRYNPWIYLRPIGHQRGINHALENRRVILLLPMGLPDRRAAEEALQVLLAPKGEMQSWLQKRRPVIRAAIAHKQAMLGMDLQELIAALGPPLRWLDDKLEDTPVRVAWFGLGYKEAWLAGQKIVKIENARRLRIVGSHQRAP